MKPHEIKARIETLAPGTKAELVDLTGTQDHWQAVIVSTAFSGKTLLEQHRLVFGLFTAEVKSNDMHALSLKTYTPEQWEKNK